VRLIASISVAVALGTAAPSVSLAQNTTPSDSTRADSTRPIERQFSGTQIQWYHVAGALALVAASTTLDHPAQRFVARHRSGTLDDVSHFFRHAGQPEWYATISLGTLGAGLITHNRRVTAAGGRMVGTIALTAVGVGGLKLAIGRRRPDQSASALDFDPFTTTDAAMPSGHAALGFGLASSLSDELHNPWATVGLYTIATGTALSRVYDNRHWLSDTVLGALVGIGSAKLINGRWRVFHIRPPRFLTAPDGEMGVGWAMRF
jgi:membrane-associated phospholipid phosphatase